MKRSISLVLAPALALALGVFAVNANAQGFGPGDGTGDCPFIDENGDGFNDLAPDADGDGIPNGLDPDYVRPLDGSGAQHQYGKLGLLDEVSKGAAQQYGPQLPGPHGAGAGAGVMNHYGPGDGTGTGVGPQDGTGFGPGANGDGDCDGTGSAGDTLQGQRRGRK